MPGVTLSSTTAIRYLPNSDNGGSEANKMLDADVTGILPQLGIEYIIPCNLQARDIIERLNGMLPRRGAMRF